MARGLPPRLRDWRNYSSSVVWKLNVALTAVSPNPATIIAKPQVSTPVLAPAVLYCGGGRRYWPIRTFAAIAQRRSVAKRTSGSIYAL
jgi:hypothetical protein